MEYKTKFNRIVIGLMCILALALICFNIYQRRQIKKVAQIISQETSFDNGAADNTLGTMSSRSKGTDQTPAPGSGEGQSGSNEGDDLTYQLEAAKEELEMVNKQLADEESKKAESKKAEQELQKKYREDPTYRKRMRSSLNFQYGDLFKGLNLSPEELEKFKDILVDNQMEYSEFYSELESVTPSEEKRDEFAQRQKDLHEDHEAKIKEFLGSKDYEYYQEYQETWYPKYRVASFMETLSSDDKLSEAQHQKLIEAIMVEIKNISDYLISEEDNKFLFPSERYNEESIAHTLDQMTQIDEAYVNAAQDILSPSQIEQYRAYLKQRYDQIESYMKLDALKYSSSTTGQSSDNKSE